MKTETKNKKTYNSPIFNMIEIDTDISLVMASGEQPGEIPQGPSFDNKEEDNNSRDPFKSPFED